MVKLCIKNQKILQSLFQRDQIPLRSIFDFNSKLEQLEKLNKLISDENFWKNNKQAKNITKEASTVEKVINSLNNLEKELEDLKELIELSKNENSELEQVKIQLNQFEKKVEVNLYDKQFFDFY